MRTFIIKSCVAIVLTAAVALGAGCSDSSAEPVSTIGVNALAADPGAYTGEIAVKGIVQSVDPGTSSITVIDETEYATCGLTPCNSAGIIPLFMPTSGEPSPSGALYAGELPNLEDAVVVIGEIKSTQEGLFFDVARVERGSKTVIEKSR
jgi:hypothetical protein